MDTRSIWAISVAMCVAAGLAVADGEMAFRHKTYGNRGALEDNTFINLLLSDYNGGTCLIDDLNTYIGTGKTLLGHSQNRIDAWINVTPAQAGSWEITQGFDDYMGIRIDNDWVLLNNTYTKKVTVTTNVSAGWHAVTIIYGDTYGGYGPNGNSAFANNYPIGVSINGGAMVRFDEENFIFGDPTANTSGGFNPNVSGIVCFATMKPAATCRVVVNPDTAIYRLVQAPDFSDGGKFTLSSRYANQTSGRYQLVQWELGSLPADTDLDTVFDATGMAAPNVKVEYEPVGDGGALWVNLNHQEPPMVFRHLRYPVSRPDLVQDAAWREMPLEDYSGYAFGCQDLHFLDYYTLNPFPTDQLWTSRVLAWSQNRVDGWMYVPADRAGAWEIDQHYDDYMAIAFDGEWVLTNPTYRIPATATCEMTEGWHTFTLVFGDTYGGYGCDHDTPIRISINGGEPLKFIDGGFDFRSPAAGLTGDFTVTIPGEVQFATLNLAASARLLVDPARTALRVLNAPTFADGAKLAFTPAYADTVSGRYLLMTWENGELTQAPADFFDASSVNAPNAAFTVEPYFNGGRLYVDLDPAVSVVSARWTGAADANPANPANWTCYDGSGRVVADALPNAGTSVFFSGAVNIQCPAGAALPVYEIVIDDTVTLTADCDWRGLDFSKLTATPSVPAAYETLDYISVPNGTYFNTDFFPNQDTRVVMDVGVVDMVEYWFGCWNIGYNNGAYAFCNDGAGGIYCGYGTDGGTSGTTVPNGRQVVELDKNLAKVNGTVVRTMNPSTFSLVYPLTLFAQNRTGSIYVPGSQGTVALYACQIYDNDELVRDYVPALRNADSRVGLYERVSRRFYAPFGGAALAPETASVSTARVIDLASHALFLSGSAVSAGIDLTITDSTADPNAPGELHFDVAEGMVLENTVALTGNFKLVKEGAGTYIPKARDTSYTGGTDLAAGMTRMLNNGPNSTVYSPAVYTCPFGVSNGVITVRSGAILDTHGNYGMYVYKLVMDGGTLACSDYDMGNNGIVSFGEITLTDDSALDLTATWVHNQGTLDLGGYTLTVAIADGKYIKFGGVTLTNGTIKIGNGGTGMLQIISGVDASTVDLDVNCYLEIKNPMTVRTFTNRKDGGWGWSGGITKVLGTFTPVSDYFSAVELQDGATLNLTGKNGVWSVKSLDTARETYFTTFAGGATVFVDLTGRELHSGDKLIAWETPPAADVVFEPSPGETRTYRFARKADGLYCYFGMVMILQ